MTNILVTGCAGFIGSRISEFFLERGFEVTGIDNFDPYYDRNIKSRNMKKIKEHENFKFIEGSILDRNVLKKAKDIDIICHQAAVAGVRNSLKNPLKYNEINSTGTLMLLDYFRDVKRFIYASSSSVYGEVSIKELPISEERMPNPISPYGTSKLIGEKWCEVFSEIYGIKTVALRYFTVYGPGQRPDEAINKFVRAVLNREKINIYGNGEQTRDFTYISDVVKANFLALDFNGKKHETFNIGSGKSISVNELVKIVEKTTGKKAEIDFVEKKEGDVSHTLADIRKAQKLLGYSPDYDIEQGIREYVNWVRNNEWIYE